MTEPSIDDAGEPIDRALIDEARPALGPTPAQRTRLKRAVLAAAVGSAAAGTAAVASGTGASATSLAGLGLGAKVALTVFAVVALGGGAAWLATREVSTGTETGTGTGTEPVPVPETEPEIEPEIEPAIEPEIEPETEPETEPAPVPETEPEGEPAPRDVRPRPPPPETDFGAIERETDLLREAHAASRRGDARAALELLDRHAAEFPRGALATERRAMHIVALCDTGDEAAARREATAFLATHPPPGLVARVERSCAGTEPGVPNPE